LPAALLLVALALLPRAPLSLSRPRPPPLPPRPHEPPLPLFDLGHSQPVLARGLSHRRLTPDDAQHQRHAALGRPPLYVLGNIRHRDPPLRGLRTTVVWVASTSRGAVYALRGALARWTGTARRTGHACRRARGDPGAAAPRSDLPTPRPGDRGLG